MPNENYPQIQIPTPGRVVLYAPVIELDAVKALLEPGVEEHARAQGYLPATVIRHEGEGRVLLDVHGLSGTYVSRYQEAAPGVPAPGSWCYPPIVRETVTALPGPVHERAA
jgi:hypothetical protein